MKKARVKATGEIVDVHRLCMSSQGDIWQEKSGREYFAHELDFDVKEPSKPRYNPDYWTRLEHQAAIAAMQGALANADLLFSLCKDRGDCPVKVVAIEFANACAHALVEKYKKEEK